MSLTDVDRAALLAGLAGMSAFLERRFGALTAEESRAPGPNGAFSPVEHVWHLADLERDGFGRRIGRLRDEPNPRLPDFDGAKIAAERRYRDRSLAEGLQSFTIARAANLAMLVSLPPDAWTRRGTQDGVGPVALCDMPGLMQQHDRAHVAEIAEWAEHLGKRSSV